MSEIIEETKSPLIENSESNANSQIIEGESKQSLNLTKEKSQSNVFELNRKIRWILFFLFAMLNLLMNFDHGTVPAATEQLKNYLNLSDSQLGLFGSLVFIGVIIGSLISLSIINTFNRKYILLIFLMLCGLFLILFTKTKYYILLCIDRIIIGIFQAFISIYLPLWCEQFGVEKRKTLMLALIQVVAPLGVLIGYIVTATLNMNLNSLPYFGEIKKDERWLYSFYIQSILIWGLSLCLLFFSNKYFNSKARRVPIEIEKSLNKNEKNTKFLKKSFFYEGNTSFLDIKSDEKDLENENQNYAKENSIDNDSKKDQVINDIKSDNNSSKLINTEKKLKNKIKEISFCRKVKLIFSEPLFIFCVLTMSMLYFIVTFIQYWASDYMLIALDVQDEKQRLFAFSLVCLSSPTIGLVIGGLIVDRLGGYSMKSSVIFCLICSLLCIIPAIFIPFVDSLIYYVCLLWILLFFGAALIPPTQGIIIVCLPKDIQGSGNSFSIFFFNLLGYFPAPFVYGFLKDYFNDKTDPKKGSRMAHKYTLWGVMGISVISIAITTFIRLIKDKEYTEKMGREKSKINSQVLNKNEIKTEVQNDIGQKDMPSFNNDNEICINKNNRSEKKE